MELQHVWLTGLKGWETCIEYATYQDFITDGDSFSINLIESIYDDSELTLGVF